MIHPKIFIEALKSNDIDFFTGVPDSLLKNVCAYITDNVPAENNIIAANEGGAMGLAAGYHLATGRIPVVYMQNSGEGNIINPLASLVDKEVYNIPILLIIGWRGEPGVHDEPQHIKQGKITCSLLETMGVKYQILSSEENIACEQIAKAVEYIRVSNEPFAFVIKKGTFDSYTLRKCQNNDKILNRELAIQQVAGSIETNACIVSTTGMISRELFEYRTKIGEGHERDFLTVGSMGHASQIALGIALQKKDRRIYCFDGDGSSIMHLGSMAITGNMKPKNYVHVIFNNGAHDSVGGQPTVGLSIDLPAIAKAVGYVCAFAVSTLEELKDMLKSIRNLDGPILLEIQVKKGNRSDLGRPTTTPVQNKKALMAYLMG